MPTLTCCEDQLGALAGNRMFSGPATCFRISTEVRDRSALARLLANCARTDGRIETRSAPVNRVGLPVKFNGIPGSTPGILVRGLPIALPAMVWRPDVGEPKSARSVSI